MTIHWKSYIFPLCIALTAILIAFVGESLSDLLRFDSKKIPDNQEYWRLLSAHFTHLTWSHLWLNIAGLALVFVFFGRCLSPLYWITSFIIASILISLFILNFNPEIRWYVGLSGVLHTLFILGGIANIRFRKLEGISFTAVILAKVIYEQIIGALPGSEEAAGGPVLVDAHFYGAMIGLVLAIPLLKIKNNKQRHENLK